MVPAKRILRGLKTSLKLSDADFEKFFFIRENRKGLVFERWRHLNGCGRFFNAVRHSVSDKFICTYKADEKKPKISQKQIDAVLPPTKNNAKGAKK